MSALRELVTKSLVNAGMYIDDGRFDQVRREAAIAAARHLRPTVQRVCGADPAAIAGSVGLTVGAVTRVFGHGWQQAAGFGVLARVRAGRVADVARLGALLNLGIVLFDHVVDTFPERRPALAGRLNAQLLTAVPPAVAVPSGDLGVESVAAVAVEVMSGARRLGGRADDVERFERIIATMQRGELASLQDRNVGEPPSRAVWEALYAKSALPATAVATLAKLANPAASDSVRAAVDRAAALMGEAFWIVDDLVDVRGDWDAGGWNRPLWLLLDRAGDCPASGEDAVRRLLQTGVAEAEAQRLGQVLAELAALPGSSQRALLRPVQSAVRSWVEEMPVSTDA
ncbi:MAG: hypothetical protein ACREPZ_06730 [Rhodanobacteraceae bacterium]